MVWFGLVAIIHVYIYMCVCVCVCVCVHLIHVYSATLWYIYTICKQAVHIYSFCFFLGGWGGSDTFFAHGPIDCESFLNKSFKWTDETLTLDYHSGCRMDLQIMTINRYSAPPHTSPSNHQYSVKTRNLRRSPTHSTGDTGRVYFALYKSYMKVYITHLLCHNKEYLLK